MSRNLLKIKNQIIILQICKKNIDKISKINMDIDICFGKINIYNYYPTSTICSFGAWV